MKVFNTFGELIEWIGKHHAPMHEANGKDMLDIIFHNGDIDGGVIDAISEAMDNLDATLDGGTF